MSKEKTPVSIGNRLMSALAHRLRSQRAKVRPICRGNTLRGLQPGTQKMIRALCLAFCFLALAGCRDQSNNGVKVRAPGVDVDVQPKSDTGKAKVKVEVDKR
jgi:hypothetical protein